MLTAGLMVPFTLKDVTQLIHIQVLILEICVVVSQFWIVVIAIALLTLV